MAQVPTASDIDLSTTGSRADASDRVIREGREPMPARRVLLVSLVLAAALSAATPWDKPAEQWTKVDALRVLQDSPWSPAKVQLDANYTYRHTNPQTGIVTEAQANPTNTPPVYGIELSRHKARPAIQVLWWSSKTVRSARLRLQQLSGAPNSASPLLVDLLPRYVLAIEGSEAVRIFEDSLEKLPDTVFLETTGGGTVDLQSVRFVNTPDDGPRVEFHFPREVNGHASLDVNAERVIFHCKASAKTPVAARSNTIALHAEFAPRAMRVRGVSDL